MDDPVDELLEALLLEPDPAADAALDSGLPPIDVTRLQAKWLHLLCRIAGAQRVLELGTLAGYSTIWLARAADEVVTIELDARHAEVARENLRRAGVEARVEVLVGPALEVLEGVAGPFDLVFIDADKARIPAYVEWAVRLGRPGTVVVTDNVVRGGAILDPHDDSTRGARAGLELIGRHPRLDSTALQTVGTKGHDGFAISLVT